MLSLSYWHVAVKNVTTRCCNVTLFFLDSTSRLVATESRYLVLVLTCGISCDIFASCFTSICLYTKKLSIFKTTSFFGVSTLKRLSYNRTSETFQSISVLYKKDMRSNWCFNHKMLLFRKFGSSFHSFNDCRNCSPFLRNETQSFFCLFFVLFQVKSRGLCTHSRP